MNIVKAVQAFLVGLAFAMGIVLVFDGGQWEQPVGAALVLGAVSEITWVLYAIAEAAGLTWGQSRGRNR